MNDVRKKNALLVVAFAVASLTANAVFAQSASFATVVASATNTTYDEFGRPLSRTDGDLIQFLRLTGTNLTLLPPDAEGKPSTNDVLIYEARIGYGVIDKPATAGRFDASITPRPTNTTKIIARAFNAPTLAQASFYADAQLFSVSNSTVYYPLFGATTNAIDPADDDADGLNNSWEKSYGTDRYKPDSDGDGMSDGNEIRAGTDPLSPSSNLAFVQLLPQGNGDLKVQWDSVLGKNYQVQFSLDPLDGSGVVYSSVNGVVPAAGDVTFTIVTNGLSYEVGHFRVVLVEP